MPLVKKPPNTNLRVISCRHKIFYSLKKILIAFYHFNYTKSQALFTKISLCTFHTLHRYKIFNALSQKAAEYQFKGYFSRLEMIYFNLSDVLYDEGRYDLALQNILFRFMPSITLSIKTSLFPLFFRPKLSNIILSSGTL